MVARIERSAESDRILRYDSHVLMAFDQMLVSANLLHTPPPPI